MDQTHNAEIATIDVVRCSSCGTEHVGIKPLRLSRARDDSSQRFGPQWSHYFVCATTGEPVYVRFFADQL